MSAVGPIIHIFCQLGHVACPIKRSSTSVTKAEDLIP